MPEAMPMLLMVRRPTGLLTWYYKLEKDDIETLKTKSVSIIRIATDGTANFDYEIKPKNADVIKKDLELILTK